MRYLLVANTSASRFRGRVLRFLERRFPTADAEILVDPRPEKLRERCQSLAATGNQAVVAVGGDGTVNRVLNAIDRRGVPLGILPQGRANDLAAELGIPFDLEEACSVLERGGLSRIDLLSVNGTLFSTCGGTDIAAAVAARANRWMRSRGLLRFARRFGSGVYVAAAIRELLEPIPVQSFRLGRGVSGPVWDTLALFISNQRRFGGRFEASPHASNRDGLFNICVLPRPRSTRDFANVLRGAWRGRLGTMDKAIHWMATEAVIAASRPVRFFGDGEILAEGRRFVVHVHHAAARVITPPARGRL